MCICICIIYFIFYFFILFYFLLTAIVVNKESKHSPALYPNTQVQINQDLKVKAIKYKQIWRKNINQKKNSFTFVDQIQNKKEKEEEDAFHFHNNNNDAAHMLIDHPFPG